MSEHDVIAETTDGRYRVILEQDTDCERPMDSGDWWVSSVLLHSGTNMWTGNEAYDDVMRDGKDRVNAVNHFEESEYVTDTSEAFKRYMRIFHGIEVFDVTVVNGYRDTSNALAWVEPSERERVGLVDSDERYGDCPACLDGEPHVYLDRDIVGMELAEHNRWAEGDCWGYVVQELVEWVRIEDRDELGAQTRETWERVDSCWGLIGHEYAEQEARDALASYGEVE